jgi:hypothetical protein
MKSYTIDALGTYTIIQDPLETIREGMTPYYLVQRYGWGEYAPHQSRFTSAAVIRTYAANHSKLSLARTNDEFPYDFLIEFDFGNNAIVRLWCDSLASYLRAQQELKRAVAEQKEWH